MAEQRGVGVELQISGDKAKANIQSLIEQLATLEKRVNEVNSQKITLGSKADLSGFNEVKKTSQTTTSQVANDVQKVETQVKQSSEKSARYVEQSTQRASKAISGVGSTISKIGDWGKNLNDSITQFTNSALSPIRGIFNSVRSFVTTTVDDSIEQIEKLELARVGLSTHFKNDENFNIDDYIERIRTTATKTQGLSAGDLADYISQLAPLSANDSEAAFAAAMGALKVIKVGGGDTTTDMMSIIKNIRDVQSKGKAYQMDINQFNRAAPLLTSMLEQQGLKDYIKYGADGTKSLNITKDNYQGLLNAFAQLNSNKELTDAFNAMSNTLSGLIEQTKQSLANDVMDLIEYSEDGQDSLLDLWKNFLNGTNSSSLRSVIQTEMQKLVSKFVGFLNKVDFSQVAQTAYDSLKEFGQYAKDTLLPVVKELVGIEGEATPTDVIKGLISLLKEFGKGIVNGIKSFMNVLNTLKSFAERIFGENGAIVLAAFGWVKGFSKMGWDLVSAVGGIVKGFGNVSSQISKLLTKYFGTSGIQNLGLGLATAGTVALAGDVMLDNRSASEKLPVTVAAAGMTTIGLTLAGHPLIGVIAGLVEGIAAHIANVQQDTEALKKKFVDEQETDLGTTQEAIVSSILDDYASQDNPIYRYGDETSEKAAAKFREWAKENITNEGTEEDMIRQTADAATKYKEIYENLVAGNKFLELSNKYLGEVGGKTRLTTSNANETKNAEALKKYWKYAVDLGFVQQFANWDKVKTDGADAGASILSFLMGNKIWKDDPTVEGLQNVIANLGEVDGAITEIENRNPQVNIQVLMETEKVTQAANEIKSTLEAAGLTLETIDGKKKWVAEYTARDAGQLGLNDGYEGGKKPVELGKGKSGGVGFNSNKRVQGISSESATALQNMYKIEPDKLLPQWNGAKAKLANGTLSDEDLQNWGNSVTEIVGKAMSIIFNGGKLSLSQATTVAKGLEDIYGTWNQVLNVFDPEQVMVLVHGIQRIIGEDTAVAVQMLRDGYDFGNIGITGNGVDKYKEASANHEGQAFYFEDLWEDIKKQYLQTHALYKASGGPVAPVARPAKPLFFNWGGQARGIDTIPAMLSPGEFVEKSSAVKRAGLGVMNALNEGDLGRAYRLIGAKLNSATNTSYDSRRYDTHDSHNTTNNNVRIFNTSRSAANTSYRGLRNIMALR